MSSIIERLNTVYVLCQIEADTSHGKTKMRLEDASAVAKDALLEIEELRLKVKNLQADANHVRHIIGQRY